LTLSVQSAARTDVGLMRRDNQDSYGTDPELGLYLVCDGMGGVAGGSVASDLAARTFLAIARQEIEAAGKHGNCCCAEATLLSLCRAVAAANRAVVERARWDTCYRGMGTTLVGVRILEDQLTIINVGDSRAYLVRGGEIKQLTEDHSYVAERIRFGMMSAEEAAVSPMRSVITRAVGIAADIQPDIFDQALQPGDTVLLASDGLTRELSAAEVGDVLSAGHDAETACGVLIERANERGGSDNITCIVVRTGLPDRD
jgi:serine/threonine protein phosphatase PrpC